MFVSYIFPPVRVLEFVLGITLALDLREGRRSPVPWPVAAALAAVAYVLAGPAPMGVDFAAVTVLPFALLIWAAAQRDIDGRRTVFARPWLVLLGEWSFYFYLVHRPVMQAALRTSSPAVACVALCSSQRVSPSGWRAPGRCTLSSNVLPSGGCVGAAAVQAPGTLRRR